MPRRWGALTAVLVALVALACKSSGAIGVPGPSGTVVPRVGFPSSMAALGDSVTTAYGSCLAPASCPRNSWSTGDGTQVRSHYRRIMAANPAIRGHARNLASPGATAADLGGQARSVSSTVEYVTIEIGANDACRPRIDEMTSVADFRAAVDGGLDALKTAAPHARVLVVSLPDIYRVWVVGHTHSIPVHVWAGGVCPSLLANATSTAPADTARRAAFRDRVAAYNQQLAEACTQYGSRCRFSGDVANVAFSLTELSALDFFHPNAAGQNDLAATSYPGTFTW
jgi:lysophospholipase L1-like esterase